MSNSHQGVAWPTVINNSEYLLQSRTVKNADGSQHLEYRLLLADAEVKSWARGKIRAYFS